MYYLFVSEWYTGNLYHMFVTTGSTYNLNHRFVSEGPMKMDMPTCLLKQQPNTFNILFYFLVNIQFLFGL